MDRCYNEFGFFAFCSVPFVLATRPHRLELLWVVTNETMHTLYHRQSGKVIQALAEPFSGDGRDAAEILQTLPPLK